MTEVSHGLPTDGLSHNAAKNTRGRLTVDCRHIRWRPCYVGDVAFPPPGFEWLALNQSFLRHQLAPVGGGAAGGVGTQAAQGDAEVATERAAPRPGEWVWLGEDLEGAADGHADGADVGLGVEWDVMGGGGVCKEYGYAERETRQRVFDGFSFFQELDMLEVRLHELAPVVHRFVIVEAQLTHAGIVSATEPCHVSVTGMPSRISVTEVSCTASPSPRRSSPTPAVGLLSRGDAAARDTSVSLISVAGMH